MAIEDLPGYQKWSSSLKNLLDAKKYLKADKARQIDVDRAQEQYDKACDEIADD